MLGLQSKFSSEKRCGSTGLPKHASTKVSICCDVVVSGAHILSEREIPGESDR